MGKTRQEWLIIRDQNERDISSQKKQSFFQKNKMFNAINKKIRLVEKCNTICFSRFMHLDSYHDLAHVSIILF